MEQLSIYIRQYFEAKNRGDAAAVAQCFASEGIVHDEGEEVRGRTAIAKWAAETSEKYSDQTEVLGFEESEGEAVVRGQVSGNFPGSPVELRFRFGVGEEGILALRVE